MILIRSFSYSTRLHRVPEISKLILDQLKDSSKLDKHKDVIVLNPFKYHAKKRHRNKVPNNTDQNLVRFFNEQNKNNIIPFFDEYENGTESVIKLINNMKVSDTLLSERKIKLIKQKLATSFSKTQLNDYIKSYYEDSTYTGKKRGIKSKSKNDLTNIILTDLWNVKKSGVKSNPEDLLITHENDLLDKDLFLLLSRDGTLINYLSRTGCKITFNSRGNKLKFMGTEDQITTSRIILDLILNNKIEEKINLKLIKELFLVKYNEFNTNKLSQLTQVYFEKLDDEDNYNLVSLNSELIKRAKRSVLWLLDSNPNVLNYHKVPSIYNNDYNYLPVKINESLTFNERTNDFFRLINHSEPMNSGIKQQFDSFKQREEYLNDNIKPLTEDYLISNEYSNSLNDNKPSLNEKLPKINDSKYETVLNDDEIKEIFTNLSKFDKQSSLIESSKLLNPQFVISFGNVLLETQSSNQLIPTYSPDKLINKKFNSSIPLINDKIFNLPIFDKPELTVNDLIELKNDDPYKSVVQLTFQPSIYNTFDKNLIKYPPIEMWADINQFGKIEMDSFQLLTAEDEINYLVSLPQKSCDLKISSQLIGNLLYEENFIDDDNWEGEVNFESLLNSTTKKYSKFKQQPYLEDFLVKSTLNFKGSQRTNIEPIIKIKFGDTIVDYQYISTNFRRVIEFEYKNKLLQYTIIEGGPLGGRRSEISLSGNDFNLETMKELIDDSILLINQL